MITFSSQSQTKDQGEWYVIRVISGTEENVKESIMQRRIALDLESYILEVFVPTHDSISVRGTGAKVRKKKNIFPGYILVRMIVTNESWYVVRNTPNVTGFLGAGTIPVPVRGDELEKLKGVLDEKSEEYNIRFRPGDIVIITKGPFQESEGIIMETNESKGLVKVNVNILGRDTPVELDLASVKIKTN